MKPVARYSDRLRQLTTLVAIWGSIAINALSNIKPPNGINIGRLSNLLFAEVQIIPANYAFAIWGVIYIGLVAFGFYQLQTTQRQSPRLRRGGYWLVVACLAQCLWVYAFLLRQFSLSVLVMMGILLPLIGFYQQLGIGHERVSSRERWLVDIPIGVYLGWISVATVVNVAIALYSADWGGWGLPPTLWTVVMMVVSAAIAAIMLVQRHDLAFTAVIAWALVAIVARSQSMPILTGVGSTLAIGLLVGMFIIKSTTPSAQTIEDLDQ